MPSLTRFTARVSESPGTKPAVVTGTAKPCCVTSMCRVPDWMVVATGVLLSVKVPKVPMPATAAAAPMTPSEPTTLRAVELARCRDLGAHVLRTPCVRFVDRAFPATGRTLEAQPQATRQRSARNPQGLGGEGTDRAFPGIPGFSGLGRSARRARQLRGSRAPEPRESYVPDSWPTGSTVQDGRSRGSVSVKVVPSPSALSTSSVPPCAVVMALVMARPRPTPGTALRCAVEARKKRGEQLPLLAGGDADAGVADRQLGDGDGVRALVGADLAVRGLPGRRAARASPGRRTA